MNSCVSCGETDPAKLSEVAYFERDYYGVMTKMESFWACGRCQYLAYRRSIENLPHWMRKER